MKRELIRRHVLGAAKTSLKLLTKDNLLDLQYRLWSSSDVTREMIVKEIDWLLKTKQIIEGQDGIIIIGEFMKVSQASKIAAQRIFENLCDRRGVGDELESCDREVQQGIIETIATIIDTTMKESCHAGADSDNEK